MTSDVYVATEGRIPSHEMDSAVYERIAMKVSIQTGFPEKEVWDFIRFLMLDNELQERYNAFRAAKRIIGDPLKD